MAKGFWSLVREGRSPRAWAMEAGVPSVYSSSANEKAVVLSPVIEGLRPWLGDTILCERISEEVGGVQLKQNVTPGKGEPFCPV